MRHKYQTAFSLVLRQQDLEEYSIRAEWVLERKIKHPSDVWLQLDYNQ